MKHLIHRTAALGLVLLLGLTACADLDVINPDAADTERALGTPGDIESLIGSAFNQWWQSAHDFDSGSPILGNQSFMMSSWPANFGMFFYSRLPGVEIVNDPTHEFYTEMVSFVWNRNYRALSMVASGLNSLDDPEIAGALGAERVERARTFGKFMQGMAHASLAVRYDEGWIIDETTEVTDEGGFALVLETVPYQDVMAAALGYFDEAIAMAEGATWTIPSAWVPASATLSAAELARVANSMKARFRANVARTPEERQAVDWAAVVAEVDAGVTTDWSLRYSWFGSPFQNAMVGQFSNPSIGWNQMSYMMYGMADQSGMYQDWLDFPVADRHPNFPDGSPRLIHTPDLRFPQGETLAEQRENPGMPHSLTGSPHIIIFGSDVGASPSWGQPARGTHRWSYYRDAKTAFHRDAGDTPTDVPEITMAEMRLLRAEAGIYGQGGVSLAEVADAINVTRTAAGLAPTDAGGANPDCVPRLPDGSCGDLFEMLKWEKRNETAWFGMNANTWWFDGRGWGDLYRGTALQMPVPCLDRELMNPAAPGCDTYGGAAPMSSPGSSYNFPHEG